MGVRPGSVVFIVFVLWIVLLAAWARPDTLLGEDTRRPFTIGLAPEQNVFRQMERYAPLAEYLSEKTGLDVRLKVFMSYGKVIDDFIPSGMDSAFFGSLAYVLAHERIGVRGIVRPEDRNGSSLYHGLVFVRKDSGIRHVTEMRGKRFAFVDPATTAGFLLPLVYLRSHGVKDYKSYLGETYFTGTHEDAIYDVLNGKADIGAAKNTVFWRLAGTDQRINRELKILTRSPDMPETSLAVRKDLDPQVGTAIRDTLLQMHNDPLGLTILRDLGARRFVPTTDADFEPVVGYLRQIGCTPKNYRYPGE
jgi:phosphonate transport system substrate-binding protein